MANTQTTTNNANTTSSLDIIKSIHHIDGFNPDELTTAISVQNPDGTYEKKQFLSLPYKKTWARLKFPHYKVQIVTHDYIPDTSGSGGYSHCIARFYEDKNDAENAYIGEGESFTYVDPAGGSTMSYINEAMQLAKGSAISKALTDAGFGLQYYMDNMDELLLKAEAEATEANQKKETRGRKSAKAKTSNTANNPVSNTEPVAKASIEKKDVSATSVPNENSDNCEKPEEETETDQKNASAKTPMVFNLETALNTKVDCGKRFLQENKLLKDLSPEELIWVYGNSKTLHVRKACLIIAKNTDSIAKIFFEHGIPV